MDWIRHLIASIFAKPEPLTMADIVQDLIDSGAFDRDPDLITQTRIEDEY